jgi:hypothetical protein
MELRLDRLLAALREHTAAILEAIDRDPLLLKKESGGLVLANASQELFTPRAEHQLYAKGIVYRRDPYRLVSLPLIKIYNLGEHNVSTGDLADVLSEAALCVHFLRKIDGSLIQVFRADGRVWFTTRGMIEGARGRGQDREESRPDFDYLGTARRLAEQQCPALFRDPALLDGRTLLFELIHPAAQKVTNYGDRRELILLTGFDHARGEYLPYPRVAALAAEHGLPFVDALAPQGQTLAERIANLLAALAGTDQEGSVLEFARADAVVYRVKVKSPDYLQLMRALAECTYDRTVGYLDANPHLTSWEEFEAFLKDQGREAVPEELLPFYRQHYEEFRVYLEQCEWMRRWALCVQEELNARLGSREGKEPAAHRKAFAALAGTYPHSGLIFAALDGRLDLTRIRKQFGTLREARDAVAALRELGV